MKWRKHLQGSGQVSAIVAVAAIGVAGAVGFPAVGTGFSSSIDARSAGQGQVGVQVGGAAHAAAAGFAGRLSHRMAHPASVRAAQRAARDGSQVVSRRIIVVGEEQIASLATAADLSEASVRAFSEGWVFYAKALSDLRFSVPRSMRKGKEVDRYHAMLAAVETDAHQAALDVFGNQDHWRGAVVAAAEELREKMTLDEFRAARTELRDHPTIDSLSPQAAALALPYAMLANDPKAKTLIAKTAPTETFTELIQRVEVSGLLRPSELERMRTLNTVLNIPTKRFRALMIDKIRAVLGPDATTIRTKTY